MPDIFMGECPSVATIHGSEVRVSLHEPLRARPVLDLAASHRAVWGDHLPVSCGPSGGVPIRGALGMTVSKAAVGNARNNLTLGARSTNTSSDDLLGRCTIDAVGVASVTLAGQVRFKYWNDHRFWWWPIRQMAATGDTAGLS